MKKMTTLNKIVTTGVCIALCLVLPMALHSIPNAGTLFSPMHLPVLLCGLICGAPYGLACGLIGPLLSSMITSMPAAAMLPSMMIELAVYGLVSGLLILFIHTGKVIVNLYISLIGAMIAGRIIAGIARALIFAGGTYSWNAWATAYFVKSLPGIIIQLILIPIIYLALHRANIINQSK